MPVKFEALIQLFHLSLFNKMLPNKSIHVMRERFIWGH